MLTILKAFVTSFAIRDSRGGTFSTVKIVLFSLTIAVHSREARLTFTHISSISTVSPTKTWWTQTPYNLGIDNLRTKECVGDKNCKK